LSSTKLAPLVKVVEAEAAVAGLAAEVGVVVMAAEVVVAEAEVAVEAVAAEAVVAAGIAAIVEVEAAATGAGSCHLTIRICNETGEPAVAGSLFSFLAGLPSGFVVSFSLHERPRL
jgi:hypothetical protein